MPRVASSIAAIAALMLSLRAGATAAPDAAPPIFQGTWIATAGAQVFHGDWSAQAIPGNPDDAQGSWSMVNDAGDAVAKGTWSAQRSRRGFRGKWSARAMSGALYSGTFEAHLPGFKGKTLQDMFAETKTRQIAGTWRTRGGMRGNWYFKGAATAP